LDAERDLRVSCKVLATNSAPSGFGELAEAGLCADAKAEESSVGIQDDLFHAQTGRVVAKARRSRKAQGRSQMGILRGRDQVGHKHHDVEELQVRLLLVRVDVEEGDFGVGCRENDRRWAECPAPSSTGRVSSRRHRASCLRGRGLHCVWVWERKGKKEGEEVEKRRLRRGGREEEVEKGR